VDGSLLLTNQPGLTSRDGNLNLPEQLLVVVSGSIPCPHVVCAGGKTSEKGGLNSGIAPSPDFRASVRDVKSTRDCRN